ncbi:hypothetical protein TTHERM_001520340 (macronuclear) [Tetrahymena thermophila SB210]|uniref:Uncharacterized protein n=1 Tax=Tetrahymena thermophila (strain SB210) TaxID=312017 RepID=W7WWR0_TETTS|nr:hypothetical protein TTHERM_001520340 [Tetrahymena thermophila SB210]EWS71250.1 hypothetical protein TTHERM_001520340 [Tetrahymena thermophila SB210]|eukprot:XP_012656215.1 hypothetical protein TTHERM_001520340 [Tetrahymena thermophila SB210]
MTYDRFDTPLTKDLVVFRFQTVNGPQINSKDKIFLVYIACFYNISLNINQFLQLDVTQCIKPNLQGFYCLDFSKVSKHTSTLSNNESIQSKIEIFTYGCLGIDSIKTTVPKSCTNQTKIDNQINGFNSILRFIIYILSQIESSYKVT